MPTSRPEDGLARALALVDRGLMRVDAMSGMVYATFSTTLYTYERPVGALNTHGYVVLSLGKGEPQVYAHRLIWQVATGEVPSPPLVVNHINGIKHDNRLTNLELVTQSRNITHAYETGLNTHCGEGHGSAKVSNEQARQILALSFSESSDTEGTADRFGVSRGLVNAIWSGRRTVRAS